MKEKKPKTFLVTVHLLVERTYRVQAADKIEALTRTSGIDLRAGWDLVEESEIYQYSEAEEEKP